MGTIVTTMVPSHQPRPRKHVLDVRACKTMCKTDAWAFLCKPHKRKIMNMARWGGCMHKRKCVIHSARYLESAGCNSGSILYVTEGKDAEKDDIRLYT